MSIIQSFLVRTAGFFVIWILLSASFDLFHLALGLAVAFAVASFNTAHSASRFFLLRLRFIHYFVWLLGRILQSGFHLSRLILHPALPIDPKMVTLRSTLPDDAGIVLLGNSITLTPGTLTVEVNSKDLVVHAMDGQSAHDVTTGRMEQQIACLFSEKGAE